MIVTEPARRRYLPVTQRAHLRSMKGHTTMKRSIATLCATAAVPMLLTLGACAAAPDDADGRAPITLTGAGATFAMPLITLWGSEYQDATRDRVNYNSIGSGGGIRAHVDRTVDFAASEAPLNAEQYERAPGTLTLPFTIGTVTLAFNLPGVTELRLTGDVLADIYLGTITRWDHARIRELNPGAALPDRPIVVAHRSDGSGTTYVFTDYLSKVSPAWRDRVGSATSVAWPTGIGGNGNEGVAGAIRNNPYSIGYIELSYASSLGMPTAAVRNRAGSFVRPTLEGGTAAAAATVGGLPAGHERWTQVSFTDPNGADSYPISSFSYFFIYEDLDRLGTDMTPERAEAIVRWVEWAVTEGQQYNNDVQNAAIPESVRTLNLATLDRVTFRGERVRTW
jgi:phosphate transport system substrate-binding protein